MKLIAGVDEVGRGPLAGPVVAAAVILPEEYFIDGLADSKKLRKNKREALDLVIRDQAIAYSLAQASCEEIDKLNILHATMLAMQRAVAALKIRPHEALIDGNRLPDLQVPARAIIGGDALEPSISAASIIAKVERDRQMKELAERHPHYGWHKNSGYPTKEHLTALVEHGITPHHRRSFAPVAKLLKE